jgi:hypothetical protein
VGILVWDADASLVMGNAISEAREHAIVANTALGSDRNDLGGGSIWSPP